MQKEFVFSDESHTIGNLLCEYLNVDSRVWCSGYQITRDNSLTVKITTYVEPPDTCLRDAIIKCKSDLAKIDTEIK